VRLQSIVNSCHPHAATMERGRMQGRRAYHIPLQGLLLCLHKPAPHSIMHHCCERRGWHRPRLCGSAALHPRGRRTLRCALDRAVAACKERGSGVLMQQHKGV
jgi:hypothetical protein